MLGLAVALALHAAVLAALMTHPAKPPLVEPPQRIEVTLSDDVGLTSTSPNPNEQAAPDIAPELGEAVPAPAPAPQPAPAPEPIPAPAPQPIPQPRAAPPTPAPRPAPKPVRKPAPKPAPPAKPAPKPAPKAAAKPAAKAPPRKSPIDNILAGTERSANTATKPSSQPKKAGGSRVGSDFLAGVSGAQSNQGKGAPAAALGPAAISALNGAISRQLKPHWASPQGVDVELLVTKVRFRLNPDGSLAGEPQVLGTTGQTAANAAQVKRHQEQAVRAVKLAAPFNLPEDLYNSWKVVTTNFDRRLSQ